ncbi:MAG: hypothetical protein ACYS47_08065 [Planctomycetota bacterium]|jgi:hypothetical protein
MATPTKEETDAHAPVRKDSLGEKIARAELKIECLRGLGVNTRRLDAGLAKAKAALAARQSTSAAASLDELLILFSILSEEIDLIIERFLESGEEGKDGLRPPARASSPSLNEVRETVEDAFLKSLHSRNLRRMVEVIALEKVRSVLSEEDAPTEWVEKAVQKALSRKGATKRKGQRG